MNDYNNYDDCRLLTIIREEGELKEQALNILWNRYSKKLFSYCLFNTENSYDAEEIHQLSWIKFYNYVISGKEILNVNSFLHSIAYFAGKESYRQKETENARIIPQFNIEDFADTDNLIRKFENDELLEQVILAIQYLDEQSKEVFLLRWFGELKYEEIGQIVGETSDSVRMRCNRAMEKVIKISSPVINDINNGDI
jgi:RNA polymerase sigma factor (sigma-70 family)